MYRYLELLTTITNLHQVLHKAILDGNRGLPDTAGIKLLLSEIDINANHYYTIHHQLNSEIDVALATLKSVKFWAIPKFAAKTAGVSVSVGGCTYGLFMVYFHSNEGSLTSWRDWRAETLGAVAAIGTAIYVLTKKQSSSETQDKV